MKRIDSINARQDVNGIGKKGFSDNADLPQHDATYLTPDWLNTIQEELCNLLEKNGIDLNSDSKEQLYELLAVKGAAEDNLSEHINAANPHPQYVLKSEGAEKLKTARAINGVLFDGTQDINIPVGSMYYFMPPFENQSFMTGRYSNTEILLQLDKASISPVSFQTDFTATQIGVYVIGNGNNKFDIWVYESNSLGRPTGTPLKYFIDNFSGDEEKFGEIPVDGNGQSPLVFKAGRIYWIAVINRSSWGNNSVLLKANDNAVILPFATEQPCYQFIKNYSAGFQMPFDPAIHPSTISESKPPIFLFKVD